MARLAEQQLSGRRLGDAAEAWPALPLGEWKDTYETLHMWTQIVGKVSLALCTHINHWWESTLRVSPRGLRTVMIPYGPRAFEAEFDFIGHKLAIRDSRGAEGFVPLYPRSVADFYREFMAVLRAMEIEVEIWPKPVEVPNPIPFPDDETHASYDPEYVRRFQRILVELDTIFKQFRGRFQGKVSPVHFFWGAFDLAVTRFSGRRAPERAGADAVTKEAYSHEVASVGFWPGSGDVNGAAFYAYAAPEPPGYAESSIRPPKAFYHQGLGEYLLLYDDVRLSQSPADAVLEFFESTYEAAADLAHWDRAALERRPDV